MTKIKPKQQRNHHIGGGGEMLQRAWGQVAGVKAREESSRHSLMPELGAAES